ncbi:MAG: hypothetical protein LQ351_004059 [Letrouitia transgressa]|nr:MAG: hypothetical protein LQ351_004059 [Letrouitia transgressa]
MIDFSLSAEQAQTQQNARAFAAGFLDGARASYTALPNGPARFQSTKPILQQATALGLVRGLIPSSLGGTGSGLVDSCLAVEELHAVEPSVALTLLANGLGLSPLIMGGSSEQQKEFLTPFLNTEGSPLASLVFSEPEGSANFFEIGGKGMQTTASKEGDRWTLNGEKVWATNCAGWDFKGADLQVVACRDASSTSKSHEESAMILLVTRELIEANEPGAFTVVKHLETPGHTACSGPHVKFSNLRVPESYVLAAPGSSKAVQLIQAAFTSSAVIVGAMSVGVMRAAFDCAFKFAKTHDAGGTVKLIERQSVADLLIDIKMRVEAARVLTWKAAHTLDRGTKSGPELAYEAKIWCSEAAVKSCTDAMKVVGISSYSNEYPLATYLADATVLPIFDGGNVGIRRRQIQQLFLAEDHDPWAPAFSALS